MEFTSGEIVAKLQEMAPQMGVDPALARAIFIAENSANGDWNPGRKVRLDTRSPVGAFGVMQVMPQTHAGLIRTGYLPPTNKLSTLEEQMAAGLAAIKEAQDGIGSKDPTATAVRYNASMRAFQNWKATGVLPAETAHYITKVAKAMGPDGMKAVASAAPAAAGSGSTVPAANTALSGLTAENSALNTLSGQMMEMMRALVGETQQAAEAGKAALASKVSGTLGAKAATTDAANAQEAQQRSLLNAASGDMLNPDSMIAKAQAEAVAAAQRSSMLESEIAKLQGMNPLEDPVGWFIGQVKLNGIGKQWDVAKQTEQRANNTISSIQSRVDAQSKIQPALVADMRVRALDAEKTAMLADATLAGIELEDKTRRTKMQTITAQLSIGGDAFQRSIGMSRLAKEMEEDAMRRAERAGSTLELTRKNDVLTAYGLPKLNNEKDFVGFNAEARDRISKAAVTGGGMGSSPGEVAANMRLFGNMGELRKSNPVMAAAITSLQQAGDAQVAAAMRAVATPDSARLAKMSPTQQLEWGIDKQWAEWRAEAGKKSMDQLKGENPFKLNAEAAAAAPELAGNGFAKYVRDRMKAGGKVPDEKELITAAMGFANATPPMPQEMVVRQLHEFFTKGMQHQATLYGWGVMNADLSDPDPKNKGGEFKYRVSPNIVGRENTGFFSRSVPEKDLNVMNLGELQNLLQKARKRFIAEEEITQLLSPEEQPAVSPEEQQRQQLSGQRKNIFGF